MTSYYLEGQNIINGLIVDLSSNSFLQVLVRLMIILFVFIEPCYFTIYMQCIYCIIIFIYFIYTAYVLQEGEGMERERKRDAPYVEGQQGIQSKEQKLSR